MRLFFAIACVLSLAACAGVSGKQPAAVGIQPAPTPGIAGAGNVPVPEPRPAVPRRAPARSKPAPVETVAKAPADTVPPARLVALDTLAGADRTRIQSVFGPADEVRDQPPGEVWIYREGGCSVELYLFPQVSAAQYAVLGHKLLPSSLADEERAACLAKLASRTPAS